jgi:hypothetical protein
VSGQILTRSERRQMERAKEKHVRKLMSGGYNEWNDVTDEPKTRQIILKLKTVPKKVYTNGMFVVQVYDAPNAWGAERVMIRWNDARPDHDWSLFQRIKNDLFGEHRVALEVYPSEEHKQDVANMYWLWVLPEGFDCPIEVKRKLKDQADE